MTIKINRKVISMQHLDQWKLKRIPKVLRNLNRKTVLTGSATERMQKLTEIKLQYSSQDIRRALRHKLALSTFAMRCIAFLSGNRRRCSVTEISMDGVSAGAISRGINTLMEQDSEQNNRINLGACPDHYLLRPIENDSLEVIEACGNSPFPLQFFITFSDDTGLITPRNDLYPYQSTGVARTKDGTLIGGVRHQFRDTNTGMEAKLVVEFPVLCPGTIVRAHQFHLACEFSSWFEWIKERNSN